MMVMMIMMVMMMMMVMMIEMIMIMIILIDDGCKRSCGTYSVEIARPHIYVTVDKPYTHTTQHMS
jgi:hypothetical protein